MMGSGDRIFDIGGGDCDSLRVCGLPGVGDGVAQTSGVGEGRLACGLPDVGNGQGGGDGANGSREGIVYPRSSVCGASFACGASNRNSLTALTLPRQGGSYKHGGW